MIDSVCPNRSCRSRAIRSRSAIVASRAISLVRHADAQRATFSIPTVGDEVRLEVSDDGGGAVGLAGSGITGMRERIAALGGLVEVGDPKGRADRHGTVVEVTVPLAGAANDSHQAEERGGR